MATMRYNDIDVTFPVAGQDNESQGFRDNFDAIQESLQYLSDSIDGTGGLAETTVKLGVENNFSINASIKGVKLVGTSEEVVKIGSPIISGTQEVSYTLGSYHSLILGADTTITLTDWPTLLGDDIEGGRYARLRVQMVTASNNTPVTATFEAANTGVIHTDEFWPTNVVVSNSTDPVIVEFWTYDNGDNIYAKYLGQFGLDNPIPTFNTLKVTGNTTLGNNISDRIIFNGIPKLPSLTTLDRDGLVSPQDGMLIYNSTSNRLETYVGGEWQRPTDTITNFDDVIGVQVTNPASGELLKYSGTAWINGSLALDNISDVVISSPEVAGQSLTYNGTNWVNDVLNFSDLNGVLLNTQTLTSGQVLAYNGTNWVNTSSLNQYTGSEDLQSGTPIADLTKSVSYFTTGSTNEVNTLGNGTDGQIKVLAMAGDGGGDMVITVTNAGWKTSGTGTVSFTSTGQSCTLQFFNSKWYCIGNNGAEFA